MNQYEEKRRQQFSEFAPLISRLIGDAAYNSGGMSFVINQLAYVETQVYERKYAPLLYQRLMTISTEGGPGVTGFAFKTLDGTGQGKRISNCADDIPYVDFAMGGVFTPVVLGGVGYHYQTEELRQAAMLNVPLAATKARLAMRAYENHMNKVAFVGEDRDLYGLCNQPNVPIITGTPIVSGGATPTGWEAVIGQINNALSTVYMASAMNTFANTILYPPSLWTQLTSIFNPYCCGDNVIDMIAEKNYTSVGGGGPVLQMQVPQLETAGTNGTRRMVVYNRDAESVVMHIPMPLTFLPPQAVNLDLKIAGEYKYSGVEIRYLSNIRYIDNI